MHIISPNLVFPKIAHGFFTREGGASDGIYASLNCGLGSGDDKQKVSENRARVCKTLGQKPDALVTCYQIHSAKVVMADMPWTHEDAPQADAIVTKTSGIILGILTADCVPVLFVDAKNGVIGAAHAGWKGAIGGVIEATLTAMEALGAKRELITAAIGPAIAQGSYEVGEDLRGKFLEQDGAHALYFIPGKRANHYLFDLPGYVYDRLKDARLSDINLLAHDTCLEENRFFSYRRACLRGEKAYGRQVSAIALKE